MQIQASEILAEFQATGALKEMRGPDTRVTGIGPAEKSGPGQLVFAAKKEFLEPVRRNAPAALVTTAELADGLGDLAGVAILVSPNVDLAHAWIKQKYGDRDLYHMEWPNVHPTAVIHESVRVPPSAVVGPLAVIGKNVKIGERAAILARVVVEYDASIGHDTVIHPGAVIGYACEIGNHCIIKANSVIGSEGFGFAQDSKRKHHRIPQTGRVVIEDRVVIGALNTVDRAAYGETRIGAGSIFDNINHVAHNCQMGEDCIVVAMTGIAGSTVIGNRVIFSGQTGVLDHLKIADDTIFLHRAGITQSVDKAGVYAFHPLMPIGDYMKNAVVFRKLHELRKKVSELDKRGSAS